jgi:mannose-6-phosphate isomerase class I
MLLTIPDDLARGPVLLRPDNFTPLQRTPWAGTDIAERYKSGIVAMNDTRIGESWEFSCDPSFPSRLVEGDYTLEDFIRSFPEAVLSKKAVRRTGTRCDILVKLLNAASPLSLQVHPDDGNTHLEREECGKPESWLVLHASPGAGLYLGFSRILTGAELMRRLRENDEVADMLQFVPVKENDYFEIGPGVPHAIGPGVTLLEPQRVLFGKTGKTYRLWDWGRRYDDHGELDLEHGKPRTLHIEEGSRLLQPTQQTGMKFVDGLRRKPEISSPRTGIVCRRFPPNNHYKTVCIDIESGSSIPVKICDGYGAVFAMSGVTAIQGQNRHNKLLVKGQSALLPHAASPLEFTTNDQESSLTVVIPSSARIDFG